MSSHSQEGVKRKLSGSHWVVTGARGFIGKNFVFRLKELDCTVTSLGREENWDSFRDDIRRADFVLHLAGENRPSAPADFFTGNVATTESITRLVGETANVSAFIFASSIHAESNTVYGESKRAAESVIERFSEATGVPSIAVRLPGVFGKWCKPNYNSVASTFCFNAANSLSLSVDNPGEPVTLAYIDDVIDEILQLAIKPHSGYSTSCIDQTYNVTVSELARLVEEIRHTDSDEVSDGIAIGLSRALYSTYVSYLPKERWRRGLLEHRDDRGTFVEFLKTPSAGQLSFFSAKPGVTRGLHYHHTKVERFLVVQGSAAILYESILDGSTHCIEVSSEVHEVVETIPGWRHSIKNIGDGELLVLVWANEVFDVERPDTYA